MPSVSLVWWTDALSLEACERWSVAKLGYSSDPRFFSHACCTTFCWTRGRDGVRGQRSEVRQCLSFRALSSCQMPQGPPVRAYALGDAASGEAEVEVRTIPLMLLSVSQPGTEPGLASINSSTSGDIAIRQLLLLVPKATEKATGFCREFRTGTPTLPLISQEMGLFFLTLSCRDPLHQQLWLFVPCLHSCSLLYLELSMTVFLLYQGLGDGV